MTTIRALRICVAAIPLLAQTPSIQLTATKLVREGSVLRGSGSVKTSLGAIAIASEKGSWDRSTGEVILTGRVHVILPPRTDHNLFRYENTALVTAGPAEIFADRIEVKDTFLRGSGNVKVRTGEGEATADRIEMSLHSADAQLFGNLRSSKEGPARSRVFPPDIVK